MKAVVRVALLLLLASIASAQTARSDPPQGQASVPPYKVDVKLVNVFVTVTDQRGAPVGGLKREDFDLLEDGVRQKLAIFDRQSALPLSIVLAVDTSLSTRKDLKLELESARAFAHSILRPQDGLALFQFSERVEELVPFTSDVRQIDRGITRVHAGAATALYDAVYLGSQALLHRQGRKVLVVITDGGDTMSQVNYHEALREAQQADAILYSIIVVPIEASAGRNTGGEHALIQMSEDTGGKYYYADSIQQVDQAFRRIGDELRTQYLLAYYPEHHPSSSDFRQIEVKVKPVEELAVPLPLRARHRAGYYTTKAE